MLDLFLIETTIKSEMRFQTVLNRTSCIEERALKEHQNEEMICKKKPEGSK